MNGSLAPFPQFPVDKVGDHLGVSVAGEGSALRDQLGLQGSEVLDDAVVNHRHATGTLWVGVAIRRRAVGGPAGVADPRVPGHRLGEQERLQVAQLALGLAHGELAVCQRSDARTVIAAVFQPPQAFDQAVRDRRAPGDSDDAAHLGRDSSFRLGCAYSSAKADATMNKGFIVLQADRV